MSFVKCFRIAFLIIIMIIMIIIIIIIIIIKILESFEVSDFYHPFWKKLEDKCVRYNFCAKVVESKPFSNLRQKGPRQTSSREKSSMMSKPLL